MSTEGPVLYVHVADDGGLLAIDGTEGRSAWVTAADLDRRLDRLRGAGGTVLLSTETGSTMAAAPLAAIAAAGVPVVAATEIHPDARRRGRLTALMSAAYVGAAALADDLLERGAVVNAADDDGYTALMYASDAGEGDIVRALLAAGAVVDRHDAAGSTALGFAAQKGHLGIVKLLLAAGADPTAGAATAGATPRQLAAANGHDQVAAVLLAVEQQRR